MITPAVTLALLASLRTAEPVSIDPKQVACLTEAVYHEARGEPLAAQIAVASTVLNRGKPCTVVREKHQFSYRKHLVKIRKVENDALAQAAEVAVLVSTGAVARYDATHFHDMSVKPKWTKDMRVIGQSGRMVFYARHSG